MAERRFGIAEGIAAALSGLTGGDFTGRLQQQIEDEKRRMEREQEREDERKHRDRSYAIQAAEMLAPIYESLGTENIQKKRPSESIPLTEGTDGKLMPETARPPEFMTGLPEVDALLKVAAPEGARREADALARGLATANIRTRERDFQTELEQERQRIEALEPVRQGIALQFELKRYEAVEPLQFAAHERRALLDHRLSLQRQAIDIASRRADRAVDDIPKPKDQFDSIAIGVAQELLDVPGIDRLSVTQIRATMETMAIEQARKWGVRLPDASTRRASINNAARYWAPQLQRDSSVAPDIGAAINALRGTGGTK